MKLMAVVIAALVTVPAGALAQQKSPGAGPVIVLDTS
jgi:hypothetical protein